MLPLLSLQAGESVLEVDCGTGVVARELVRLTSGSVQVSGVDPSALALERAATETATADLGDWADRITYRQMAGQALTFRDNTFDAAMCSRVLIHAADPQDIVAEMVRVVRPGGRIICSRAGPSVLGRGRRCAPGQDLGLYQHRHRARTAWDATAG